MNFFVSFALVVATALVATPAFAATWDDLPELEPRSQIAIKKRYDSKRYDSLRSCYNSFNSLVGAKYFAAMVDITAESGSRSRRENDASAYAAHVAQQWTQAGRVNPDRDIVVALGVVNRSLGIHIGEHWKSIGFDDDALRDALEASPVPGHLRRRTYDDTLCSLVTALDYRLASLSQQHERRLETARKAAPDAKARHEAVRAKVERALPAENELRAALIRQLDEASALIRSDEAIEAEPAEAIDAAENLDRAVSKVEAMLEQGLTALTPLDTLENELAAARSALASRADADWSDPVEAAEILATCDELAAAARRAEQPDLLAIQACIGRVNAALARADVRHHYLARALPQGVLALVVLLASVVFVAHMRRRRRTLELLRHDLATWEANLAHAGDRLDRLERDFPWYFGNRSAFWSGESAAQDERIANALNHAHLLHARGRALLERARSLHTGASPVGVRKLEAALRELRTTSITVQAGAAESERPLALPLTTGLDIQASALPAALATACSNALDGLIEVAPVQQRIDALRQQAEAAVEDSRAAIEARRKARLPVDHLVAAFEHAQATWTQASAYADENPTQAIDGLEQALAGIDAVRARAHTGNEVVDTARGALARQLHTIKNLLATVHHNGLELNEADFDPQATLERAEATAARILELVATGQEHEALEHLEPLQDELDRCARRLPVCLEAPQLVPEMLSGIDEARALVKNDVFRLQMTLRRMASRMGDDAFAPQTEAIEELRGAISRLERHIQRTSRAFDDGKLLTVTAEIGGVVDVLEASARTVYEVDAAIAAAAGPQGNQPNGQAPWQAPARWTNSSSGAWAATADAHRFRTLSGSLPEISVPNITAAPAVDG